MEISNEIKDYIQKQETVYSYFGNSNELVKEQRFILNWSSNNEADSNLINQLFVSNNNCIDSNYLEISMQDFNDNINEKVIGFSITLIPDGIMISIVNSI